MSTPDIPDQILLSAFLDNTPDHVYFKDLESRFLWVSASLARSLGRRIDEVVGRTDFDFFDDARARAHRDVELRIIRTGEAIIDRVLKHAWPDGRVTWVLNDAGPLRNDTGDIVGVWGTNKDVTESKLMEEALEVQTRALQRTNTQLEAANQELAAQTQLADEMRERAVREVHAKGELLAIVSHDMRNPFQAVLGCIELLEDTPLDPMQRDYVETVDCCIRDCLRLVNNLLDEQKDKAGKLQVEHIEWNLPELLIDVARQLSVQAHAKDVEFTVDVDPAVPEVLIGDPARIRQVLVNLVGNAVKFTERGEVTVEVRARECSAQGVNLRFAVQDTGVGIPPDRLERLFQAYSQADVSVTRRWGGTGLGLYIVRRLVELMGGTIGVDSREGLGSTFWFEIPFPLGNPESRGARPPALTGKVLVVDDNATQRRVLTRQLQGLGLEAASASSAPEAWHLLYQAHAVGRPFAAALVDHQMQGCDGAELGRRINADPRLSVTRLVLLTCARQVHEPFGSAGIAACLAKPVPDRDLFECLRVVLASSADSWHDQTSPVITRTLLRRHRGREKRHILIAEDVPAGRKVACRTLEKLGYRVNGVANGREAVAAWEAGHYDLILMDGDMPDINGYEATRMIRDREPPGQHIPIIALTGRAMPGAEQECKEAGMDAYLSKPIGRDALEACLARFLGESLDTRVEQPARSASANTDDTPLDLSALRELAADDQPFFLELIADFLRQGSSAMIELEAAAAKGDGLGLARTAHALKTAAGELQAAALLRSIASLESAVRRGSAVDYVRLAEGVRQEVTRAMEYLRTCVT